MAFFAKRKTFPIAVILTVLATFGLWMVMRKAPGSFGYIDTTGNWAIGPQFSTASPFHEGLAYVTRGADFLHKLPFEGFIDKDAKKVVECGETGPNPSLTPAEIGSHFSEGLIVIGKESFDPNEKLLQIGFADKSGRVVIQPRFDEARSFSEHMAAVRIDQKWGFIDRSGKLVIKPAFVYVEDFHNGLAVVGTVKDQQGVVESRFERPGHFGIGKWGFINKSGRFVIPPQFSDCGGFSEGLAPVSVRAENTWKWGYIDRSGKWVIKPTLYRASEFSEGLARTSEGYIDKFGDVRVKPPADISPEGDFHNGLALVGWAPKPTVSYDGDNPTVTHTMSKSGYIDKTGKLVIPCDFVVAGDFSEGRAAVATGRAAVIRSR